MGKIKRLCLVYTLMMYVVSTLWIPAYAGKVALTEKEVIPPNGKKVRLQQRASYSLTEEIKDVLGARPDVPLNVYQAIYQRGLMTELESGSIELKDAWGMIKPGLLFDVESLVERDDLKGFLHDPQASLKAEQDIQQSYFSKILSHLEHIENLERALSHPQQVLSATLKEAKEWMVQKVGQLKVFYQEYLAQGIGFIKEVIKHPDSTTVRHKLTEHLSEKAIMTGDVMMGSEERFYRVSRRIARTVVSVNERGEPIKKGQGRSVSNHAVSSLPKENPRLYFKAFSGLVGLKPGNEFMMGSLYDILNIPYPESGVLLFTNLTKHNNPPSIVMVSEGIPGKTGKQGLKEHPEFFESLDQEAYEKQVLGAMLTDHGDGKADNFICLENPTRLIPIDNEEVFVPILSEDKKGLRIKSILFTLPQMETPLSSYQRSYLNSLTPQWISYMWLREMEKRNQAYHQLEQALSFQMLKQQYQTVNLRAYKSDTRDGIFKHYNQLQPTLIKDQPLESHCYLFPETFRCEQCSETLPLLSILLLPLKMTAGRIKETMERLGLIQKILQDHKSASLQDLLDGVNPLIGAYYQKLRDTKRDQENKINIREALRFLYGLNDAHQQNEIEVFLGRNTFIHGHDGSLTVAQRLEKKEEDPAILKSRMVQNASQQIDEFLIKSLTYLREGYFPVEGYIRALRHFSKKRLKEFLKGERTGQLLSEFWIEGRRILNHISEHSLSEREIPSIHRVWNEIFQRLRPLSPSLDWLVTVEENFLPRELAEDKSTSFLIEGGWMGKRILPSKMVEELLDSQGQLKKDESLSGRSVVRGYPKKTPLFYFKAYPEFPGYEYGAISFMRRLGIERLPYSDLVIFRPDERIVNTAGSSHQASSSTTSISAATSSSQLTQSPYPVLLTQAVEGDILEEHWDKPLANLDFEHTSRLIIASMLINPEDGKEDNFILSSDGRYLIPIDNDHVFLPGETRKLEGWLVKKVNTTLQGKTILYCLAEMKRSLLSETVEFIKSINVDHFLRGWLEDLAKANEKYQNLVKQDEQTRFFKEKGTVLRIPLDSAFINNLYWKFHQLQGILTHQPELPLIEILKRIEPYLGKKYGEVLALPHPRRLETRFVEVTKDLYQRVARGNHISVLNSRAMMEIMHIPETEIIGKTDTIKQGPATALEQLDILRTESRRKEWKAYIEHGREPTAIDGNKSGEEQAYINSLMKSKTPPEIISIHNSQRLYGTFLYGDQLTPLLQHEKGTRLKLIDLKGSDYIDTKAVQIISTFAPNLEVLDVSRCFYLKEIQGPVAGEHLQFPALRRLIMNGCPRLTTLFIEAPCLQLIEASNNPRLQSFFMNTPELMSLQMEGNNIQGEDLEALGTIISQTKVTRLGNSWQEKILSLYTPQRNKIIELELMEQDIDFEGIKTLNRILPQTNIVKLGLARTNLGTEGVKALADILSQTKITELNLHHNNIEDDGIKALANVLPETQIEGLNLNSNDIGAENIKVLATILHKTKIKWLRLDDNNIGDDGIIALATILPQTKITLLHLGSNNIGTEVIKALAKVLPQTKIEVLNLNHNNIGDEGTKALAVALPKTQIIELYLSPNNIGDDGIIALATILPQTKITWLNLGVNNIGVEGFKALAVALPKTQITGLPLGGNNIGDEGVKALINVLVLPQTKIIWLNLVDNNIGDEGVKALAAALPHTKITDLYLDSNNIGDEGVKALAAALPQTKITWLDLESNNIGTEGKALLEVLKEKMKINISY